MVFKKNTKGQAAIEFLMTYGWMLLIVLIVGALIFSFVDFGSLLPNSVDLSNNLRADSTQLQADSEEDTVTIVFTYVGTQSSKINFDGDNQPLLKSDNGFECTPSEIKNLATGNNITATGNVQFIGGNLGWIKFECGANELIQGDRLDADVVIPVVNTRTTLATKSKGRVRVSID